MIISQVLMSKKNRANKQQRIVCAMSCIDVIVSTVWFFTNLFIPSNIAEFPWATGNKASCSAQGFIVQFSISSIIYNAALSFYYLLIIKYNYKGRQLQKVEKWIHITPITFGLVTALCALCLDTYNFAVWDCWIAPAPNDDKKRQQLARTLQWAFFFIPLWCAIIFATTNMIQVFYNVRTREKSSSEWMRKRLSRERSSENVEQGTNRTAPASVRLGSSSKTGIGQNGNDIDSPTNPHITSTLRGGNTPGNGSVVRIKKYYDDDCGGDDEPEPYSRIPNPDPTHIKMKCTRRVAKQGLLYVGAFFITWMFPTISRIIELSGGTIPPTLVVLSGTFIPSQGIFNALVYFRLRYIRCRKKYSSKSKFWVMKRIIILTIYPCTERREQRYNIDDGNDVEPCYAEAEDDPISNSKSSVGHNSESHPDAGDKITSSGVRSRISNPSINISYPSYPSNLSSDPSCFVSETEPEKSGLENDVDADPAKAAEKIARVVSPASLNQNNYYLKAREMAKCVVSASKDDTPQPNRPDLENFPRRSYRDVFNYRKNLKRTDDAAVEIDSVSSGFDRVSDFLSTIEEGPEGVSKTS
jgi:hypothetical protein